MATTAVQIEVGEKDYTLEFDRNTLVYLEEILGYTYRTHDDSPITNAYLIFAGGLQKHHGDLAEDIRADLFDQYREEGGDGPEIIAHLVKAYVNFTQTTKKPTKKMKIKKVV